MTRFLVVPQWQGSPSSRAMTLIDGAEAIASDLPRRTTERVPVPVEAGEALGTGIRRYSALSRTRDLLIAALDAPAGTDAEDPGTGRSDPPPHAPHVVVIGGDCGVAVPAVERAAAHHPDLAVVWFDAHADLHSPETSPSGAFAGMALRSVFASGPLTTGGAVPPERIVLAGARAFDDAEIDLAEKTRMRRISVDDLSSPHAVAEAVAATGAGAVYVHVDLDVLDPAVISGVALPEPFGPEVGALTAAITALRARFPLAGASVSGFAPSTPDAAVDDLGAILRIIGALA